MPTSAITAATATMNISLFSYHKLRLKIITCFSDRLFTGLFFDDFDKSAYIILQIYVKIYIIWVLFETKRKE